MIGLVIKALRHIFQNWTRSRFFLDAENETQHEQKADIESQLWGVTMQPGKLCALAEYYRDRAGRDKKWTEKTGWFHLLSLRDKLSWNTWYSAVEPCEHLQEAEHRMVSVLGIHAKPEMIILVFHWGRGKHAKNWGNVCY